MSLHEYSFYFCPLGSGNIVEEWVERWYEPEEQRVLFEIVSPCYFQCYCFVIWFEIKKYVYVSPNLFYFFKIAFCFCGPLQSLDLNFLLLLKSLLTFWKDYAYLYIFLYNIWILKNWFQSFHWCSSFLMCYLHILCIYVHNLMSFVKIISLNSLSGELFISLSFTLVVGKPLYFLASIFLPWLFTFLYTAIFAC